MGPRGLRNALSRATLVTGVILLWTAVQAPGPEEPLPLRWARTAASHPVRTGLALTLIWLALGRSRRVPCSGSAKEAERGS